MEVSDPAAPRLEHQKLKCSKMGDSDKEEDGEADILGLLKKMRKEQKEAAKKATTNFKAINANFEDINSKLEEVAQSVEPLKARMDDADKERTQLKKDVLNLKDTILDVREDLKNLSKAVEESNDKEKEKGEDFPVMPGAAKESVIFTTARTAGPVVRKDREDDAFKNELVLDRASRTVGLFPIHKEEVETIVKELKEADPDITLCEKTLRDKAMTTAVKEYLNYEMRIDEKLFEELNINKVFHAAGEEYRTLYIELADTKQANWILAHSGKLNRPGLNVSNHVPWQARDRHSAFQAQAFKLRTEEDRKTRVIIQKGEYVLQHKAKNSNEDWTIWKGDETTPPISTSSQLAGPRITPTKGVGRPPREELNRQKRVLSPQSAENCNDPKKTKHVDTEDTEETEDRNLDGVFTSTEFAGFVGGRRQSNAHEFRVPSTDSDNLTEKEKTSSRPMRKVTVRK